MEENQSSIKEKIKQCRVSNEMYENVHYLGKIYTAWEVEDLPICSNEGMNLMKILRMLRLWHLLIIFNIIKLLV